MKRITSLVVFMYFTFSVCIGQKVHFDLKASVDNYNPQTYSSNAELNGTRYTPLNDSTYIRTRLLYTLNNENNYQPDLGYGLKGIFSINVADRFFISSGLGLNYMSYGIDSKSTVIDQIELDKDTILIQPSDPNPPIIFSACDEYENHISDLVEIDRTIGQEILHLLVPFELGYSIIPQKLDIQAGLFFQTPVYSVTRREFIQFHMTESNDLTICGYEKVVEKDISGNGFRDAQWGMNAEISYEVFNHIRLAIGVRKAMTSVYVDPEYQSYPLSENSYKPFMWSAGIGYRFGYKPPGLE